MRNILFSHSVVCVYLIFAMVSASGSLRMSSWEDVIQVNKELPALSEAMWVSQVG